jgi:hypothetical protein
MEPGKLRNKFDGFEIQPGKGLESEIFYRLRTRKRWLTLPLVSGMISFLLLRQLPDSGLVMKKPEPASAPGKSIFKENKSRIPVVSGENTDSMNSSQPAQSHPHSTRKNQEANTNEIAFPSAQKKKHQTELLSRPDQSVSVKQPGNLQLISQAQTKNEKHRQNVQSILAVADDFRKSPENVKTQKPSGEVAEAKEPESNPVMAEIKSSSSLPNQTDSLRSREKAVTIADTIKPNQAETAAKSDSATTKKQHLYSRFDLSLQAGYALMRRIEMQSTNAEVPVPAANARNGLYGSMFMAGIQYWMFDDKALSCYASGEAGVFVDYFKTISNKSTPGDFDARFENNTLLLKPNFKKAEALNTVKNLLLSMGTGIRYRFQNRMEFRMGISFRSAPVSRLEIKENGESRRQTLSQQSVFSLNGGISVPLTSFPEKWGKFRLEILYSQDNRAGWQISGKDKASYGFTGMRLIRQFGK